MTLGVFSHALAMLVGFILDLILGDPRSIPHPIRLIGTAIAKLEGLLRKVFPSSKGGQRAAGVVLVIVIAGGFTALTVLSLWICGKISFWLAFGVECIIDYQMLATRSLIRESDAVRKALVTGTLEEARYAVSMIVGRDTKSLSKEGVAKAAVETVAENAIDGVFAPMFFMALFGAPGAVFYKAVNTMDSMVGYKNDKYQYFGTAAAMLDDVLNFIPARLGGLVMVLAAFIAGFDGKRAWRVFWRDRRNHKSPNSAHSEAACAGALGLQLAGDASYFGVMVHKPTIGDATRAIEAEDIRRSHRLLLATAWVGLVLCLAISCAMGCVTGGVL